MMRLDRVMARCLLRRVTMRHLCRLLWVERQLMLVWHRLLGHVLVVRRDRRHVHGRLLEHVCKCLVFVGLGNIPSRSCSECRRNSTIRAKVLALVFGFLDQPRNWVKVRTDGRPISSWGDGLSTVIKKVAWRRSLALLWAVRQLTAHWA